MASNPAGDVAPPPGGRWLDAVRHAPLARLLIFFAVLLAADIGAQFGRLWAIRHAPPGGSDWASLGAALLFAAILLGLYTGLVRSLERRATRELAPRVIQAVAGIILGLALFSGVFGLLHVIGVAQWQGVSAAGFDVIPMLAVAIIAAVGEELAFRGALFRILEESFGTGTALTLSAALFGLLHVLNNGATVVSTTAIALEAGVLLGAAYALTRNLWFPIGLHFGWNFTEGGIFGASVSGGASANGAFSVSLSGPRLLTGGKFGPEASVIAIAVCLAIAVVLIMFVVRDGHWIAMRRLPSRQ
ncbi:MAG TPA: CPBP family intramembrane glutamic endopeptidase [Steroidobacteraceae bacterium]|nr:CPBP family intramembrane glutamic endopeptidase [Steroidobacteraceae bacterium]